MQRLSFARLFYLQPKYAGEVHTVGTHTRRCVYSQILVACVHSLDTYVHLYMAGYPSVLYP